MDEPVDKKGNVSQLPSPDPATKSGKERRRYRRRAVDTTASIIAANQRALVTIRDISATGARLQMNGSQELGSEIDLIIPHRGRFNVRKVWQHQDSMGVHFLDRTLTEPLSDLGGDPTSMQAAA